MNITSPCVAIFGGAVSGAEAAFQLSRIGIHSVLFEQNCLPYGKADVKYLWAKSIGSVNYEGLTQKRNVIASPPVADEAISVSARKSRLLRSFLPRNDAPCVSPVMIMAEA